MIGAQNGAITSMCTVQAIMKSHSSQHHFTMPTLVGTWLCATRNRLLSCRSHWNMCNIKFINLITEAVNDLVSSSSLFCRVLADTGPEWWTCQFQPSPHHSFRSFVRSFWWSNDPTQITNHHRNESWKCINFTDPVNRAGSTAPINTNNSLYKSLSLSLFLFVIQYFKNFGFFLSRRCFMLYCSRTKSH